MVKKTSSKKKKSRYPSKKEIISALLDDQELEGFGKYILIIEHRKVNKDIGIIKGELIQNDKIILRGKMTEFPQRGPDSFDWDILDVDESFFDGFSLDYKGESISQMIIQGVKKSIKEGKIPYFRT